MARKGVYSGGMGRLWECSIGKGMGYIPGGRGRFWEGRIDSDSVTYSCRKRGYLFWKGGVDSRRVAYKCLKGDASYRCLKWGIFWDGRVDSGIKRHFT